MAKCKIVRREDEYYVYSKKEQVKTPAGRPFRTKSRELANAIVADVNKFGPDPMGSLSYVTLQASYIDYGSSVPKSALVESILQGYSTEFDVALRAAENFNKSISDPLSQPNEKFGFNIDPSAYFGILVERDSLEVWLYKRSVRQLIALQIFGASCRSVVAGYSLLEIFDERSMSNLAHGIYCFSEDRHPTLIEEDSITPWLLKVQRYAAFPDDLVLLAQGETDPEPLSNRDLSRTERLGHALTAMLDKALEEHVFEDEKNFPAIPELVPIFRNASEDIALELSSRDSRTNSALVRNSCRYLWGKAIEGTLLWAKSSDGSVDIKIDKNEYFNGGCSTCLGSEFEELMAESFAVSETYIGLFENIFEQKKNEMTEEAYIREIKAVLEYFPMIAIAYAIKKNLHEYKW